MPYLRVKNELPLIPGYASGDIVRISDAFPDAPVNTLKANVSGIGCNVVSCGKNLFSDKFSDYKQPVNYRIFPIKLENGKTYKLSATLTGTVTNGCVVGIAKSGTQYSDFVGLAVLITSNGTINTINSFTADSTWTSPVLVVYANDETAFNSVFANYDIQFEQGSTASQFEPYAGTTYPIEFPASVENGSITIHHDGSVDLTNGDTTTRLTDTAKVTTLSGLNYIWVDTGIIENLVYIRRLDS